MRLTPISQPYAAAGRSTVPLCPFARPFAAATPPSGATCVPKPLMQCNNGLERSFGSQTRCSSGEKEAAKGRDDRRIRFRRIWTLQRWKPTQEQEILRPIPQTQRNIRLLLREILGMLTDASARLKDPREQPLPFHLDEEEWDVVVQLGEALQDVTDTLTRVRASQEKARRLSKTRRWGEVLLELRRSEGTLRRTAARLQELRWLPCTSDELSDVEEEATGAGQAPPQHQPQHQQAKKEERAGQQRSPTAVVEAEEHGDNGKPRRGRGWRRSAAAKEGKAPARKASARGNGRKRRPTSKQDVKPTQVLKPSESEASLAASGDDE